VERFQTIFVGLLGFAGVMLTLWYNARVGRRQGERVLRNEQASICAALHAELTIRRESMTKAIADFWSRHRRQDRRSYQPHVRCLSHATAEDRSPFVA